MRCAILSAALILGWSGNVLAFGDRPIAYVVPYPNVWGTAPSLVGPYRIADVDPYTLGYFSWYAGGYGVPWAFTYYSAWYPGYSGPSWTTLSSPWYSGYYFGPWQAGFYPAHAGFYGAYDYRFWPYVTGPRWIPYYWDSTPRRWSTPKPTVAPVTENRGAVLVRLNSPDAELFLDGKKVEGSGRDRVIRTADIAPGQTAKLVLKTDSKGQSESETVEVRADTIALVDFTHPPKKK